MAKGARSSVRKTNNSKLKARVFGPVENARTERLSAKLLELASQPKPPRSEMETEQEDGKARGDIPSLPPLRCVPVADAKPTESQTKKTSDADGSWTPFSLYLASSLCYRTHMPSPCGPTEDDDLFYHLLGLSSDMSGFDQSGRLELPFENEEQ